MRYFEYNIMSDPGDLYDLLASRGYNVIILTHDAGRNVTGIGLDDSDLKDPSSVVSTYVYKPHVNPDYEALFSQADINYKGAADQYLTARDTYISALTAWNNAGSDVTQATAIAKLKAAQGEISALAQAVQAQATAIQDLYEVVRVLALKSDCLKG
jgi:hypothetical protein